MGIASGLIAAGARGQLYLTCSMPADVYGADGYRGEMQDIHHPE